MSVFVLECPDCKHVWKDTIEPMLLTAAVARMKGMAHCPRCGKKKALILLGAKYIEALEKLKGEKHA